MFKNNKPVVGLGKAGLLPPRKRNGHGPSTNTSYGTQDINAPHQKHKSRSVITDSLVMGCTALCPAGHQRWDPNPLNPSPTINHAASSGITGAPKESEIITIGSPDYNGDDEGVGAVSAEPRVEIEESTSPQKTAAGTNDQPSGSHRRNNTDAGIDITTETVDEGVIHELSDAKPNPQKQNGLGTSRASRRAKRGTEGAEEEKRQKKRVKRTTKRTINTSKNALPKISQLIGHEVQVPGSVFFVQHPEYYIGHIKRRDPQHRNAVEVKFRDDKLTYWFPIKDVAKWMPEMAPLEPPMLPHGGSVQALHGLKEEERKNRIFDEELAAQALTDISARGGKISATVSRNL
jgi:hypothetical protein